MRRVATKPARMRLLNISVSCGRNGSAVVVGTSAASSCRHRHSVGCPWRRVACRVVVARLERPGRVGVARLVAGRRGRPGWQRATPVCRRSARSAQECAPGPPRSALHLRRWCESGRLARQPGVIGLPGMAPIAGRRRCGRECRAATAGGPLEQSIKAEQAREPARQNLGQPGPNGLANYVQVPG
jgi:hypothetical protein